MTNGTTTLIGRHRGIVTASVIVGFTGAIAGYLLGRKEVRRKVMKSKNVRQALRTIGRQMQADKDELLDEIKAALHSDVSQSRWRAVTRHLNFWHDAEEMPALKEAAPASAKED